jgi:hypothetical protein
MNTDDNDGSWVDELPGEVRAHPRVAQTLPRLLPTHDTRQVAPLPTLQQFWG